MLRPGVKEILKYMNLKTERSTKCQNKKYLINDDTLFPSIKQRVDIKKYFQ